MRRNEVKRGVPALLRINRKSVWVWPEYRAYVAGFAGSKRSANGTFQDVWAVSDEQGNWHHATPRQLRRTAAQRSQDTLVKAAANG